MVTPTAHPLVALLSAPPCPEGNQFRVEFRRAGDSFSSHTSAESCRAGRSSNVYVAGMRADTDYEMRPETLGGAMESGAWITFHTGLLDGRFPPVSIPTPRAGGARSADQLLVSSMATEPFHNQATDLEGNVVWTLASAGFLTRVLPGGRFLVLAEAANSQNDIKRWQAVRELDLLGNTIARNECQPRGGTVGEPRHPLQMHEGRRAVRFGIPSRGYQAAERPYAGHCRSGTYVSRWRPRIQGPGGCDGRPGNRPGPGFSGCLGLELFRPHGCDPQVSGR